ncbi:hypothetical protein B7767_26260, partial [Streptomyces sp. 13-12-16]
MNAEAPVHGQCPTGTPCGSTSRRRSLGAQQAYLHRPGRYGGARSRAGRQRRGGDRRARTARCADGPAAPSPERG